MQTNTIFGNGITKVMLYVAGAAIVVSSFFALSVPQAHAAALTEPQIQAILNLLKAFDVPAATIANVDTILHKSK